MKEVSLLYLHLYIYFNNKLYSSLPSNTLCLSYDPNPFKRRAHRHFWHIFTLICSAPDLSSIVCKIMLPCAYAQSLPLSQAVFRGDKFRRCPDKATGGHCVGRGLRSHKKCSIMQEAVQLLRVYMYHARSQISPLRGWAMRTLVVASRMAMRFSEE